MAHPFRFGVQLYSLDPDRWVREAAAEAGRSEDEIELNSLVFAVAITDEPGGLRRALGENSGMSVEAIAECPLFLTGPASEIRDRLEARREETGISYIVIQAPSAELLEEFAEQVVAPLSGH